MTKVCSQSDADRPHCEGCFKDTSENKLLMETCTGICLDAPRTMCSKKH